MLVHFQQREIVYQNGLLVKLRVGYWQLAYCRWSCMGICIWFKSISARVCVPHHDKVPWKHCGYGQKINNNSFFHTGGSFPTCVSNLSLLCRGGAVVRVFLLFVEDLLLLITGCLDHSDGSYPCGLQRMQPLDISHEQCKAWTVLTCVRW